MKNEICVMASALAAGGGDGEEMATPAVGDEVEFSGKGKVSRVEGENAYIEVTEINGEPVMGHDAAPEPPADDTESSMDNMVAQQRGAGGGY